MKNKENEKIPEIFWQHIAQKRWNDAKSLLADDFEALWPQSREKMNRDDFIAVNQNYPGTHQIQILSAHYEYDHWSHHSNIATQVHVKSQMPDGKLLEFYATSFFEVVNERIISLVEYWAETYPAPEGRKQWVEQY